MNTFTEDATAANINGAYCNYLTVDKLNELHSRGIENPFSGDKLPVWYM